jgi:hypothetical protein
MRTFLSSLTIATSCLLIPNAHAHAQALIGGMVQEVSTERPVRCLSVALEDSSGTAVDSTWTRRGGRFQFLVTQPGRYRVRFFMRGLVDARSDWEQLGGDAEVARTFRVSMVADSSVVASLLADEGKRSMLRIRGEPPRPRYPTVLLDRRTPGVVVLAIPVDTTGRADQESLIPLYASHPEFLKAALEAFAYAEFERFVLPNGQECVLGLQPLYWSIGY